MKLLAALVLAVAACRAPAPKAPAARDLSEEEMHRKIERDAEAAFAELDAEEAAENRELTGWWYARMTILQDGRPYHEPSAFKVSSSREGDAVVFKDDKRMLLRATGSLDKPAWEVWRKGSDRRPAGCPLTEGWEPAAVDFAADRRRMTYVAAHPSQTSCEPGPFTYRMEIWR